MAKTQSACKVVDAIRTEEEDEEKATNSMKNDLLMPPMPLLCVCVYDSRCVLSIAGALHSAIKQSRKIASVLRCALHLSVCLSHFLSSLLIALVLINLIYIMLLNHRRFAYDFIQSDDMM